MPNIKILRKHMNQLEEEGNIIKQIKTKKKSVFEKMNKYKQKKIPISLIKQKGNTKKQKMKTQELFKKHLYIFK